MGGFTNEVQFLYDNNMLYGDRKWEDATLT